MPNSRPSRYSPLEIQRNRTPIADSIPSLLEIVDPDSGGCLLWQPDQERERILPEMPTTYYLTRAFAALVLTFATTHHTLAEGRNYGPCEGCARGTLMQWSYGTSFSGGPDLDAPLVTDRPDFTEASSTVGRGVAQLEVGYTYTFDNDGTDQTINHSYAEPLLRLGILADWLEFRISQNANTQKVNGVEDSGATDLYLGFKIGLTPQEGWLPEMALIPQATVPTGSRAFGSEEFLPGLNWIYGWELNDFLSTAGSTQFNRANDETTAQAYTEWAQSWTVAYSLSERWGAYTEWYAFFPHSAETAETEHYFNGGFTFLVNNDIQWDIRAGTGLNDESDDYFIGTGLSLRLH